MLRLSRLLRVQKCPYAVLGVSETATTAEIKRAFQDRAKITHPDVAKGKDSHFREMVEAYRILRVPRNAPSMTDKQVVRVSGQTRLTHGHVVKVRVCQRQPARNFTITLWVEEVLAIADHHQALKDHK